MNKKVTLTAFNAALREKNCPMLNAVIRKTPGGFFMAVGEDKYGNKLYVIVDPNKIQEVVEAGIATLDGITMQDVLETYKEN